MIDTISYIGQVGKQLPLPICHRGYSSLEACVAGIHTWV